MPVTSTPTHLHFVETQQLIKDHTLCREKLNVDVIQPDLSRCPSFVSIVFRKPLIMIFFLISCGIVQIFLRVESKRMFLVSVPAGFVVIPKFFQYTVPSLSAVMLG